MPKIKFKIYNIAQFARYKT